MLDWLSVRSVVTGARRHLWMAALVFALVAVVALLRYAGPDAAARHRYIAAQALTVRVLPSDAGGTGAQASAQQLVELVARQISSGQVLTSPAFTRAVAQRLATDRQQVTSRYGAGAAATLSTVDARAVATALTASHIADRVTLTARWPSAVGAWALVVAAGETLEAGPASVLGPAAQPTEGATLRVLRDGAATEPALDPAPERAALARLLETLLLGLLGGTLVATLAAWWESRRAVPDQRPSAPGDTPPPSRRPARTRPAAAANAET